VGQLGKNFKATWLEKWGEEYNETMMHLRVFGGKGSRFPGLLNEAPEKKFSPPQRIFSLSSKMSWEAFWKKSQPKLTIQGNLSSF
jgi:hypothetical protein